MYDSEFQHVSTKRGLSFFPPIFQHTTYKLLNMNSQIIDLWVPKGLFQNVFGSLPTCNGAFGETVAGQFFGVLGLEETGDPHPGGGFFSVGD